MENKLSEKNIEKVQDILMSILNNVTRDQIKPDAKLVEDLCADSLDKVEISMALEEAFDLTVSDDVMEDVDTVEELYQTLAKCLEQAGQPV